MPISKNGDLLAYFDGYFKGVEDTEIESEYKTAFKLVQEFGEYVDMRARSSPNLLHHVYEWNLVGHRDARLFELQIIPTSAGARITYSFLKSTTLNDNGYLFADKAQVMESGHIVSFETDKPVPLYEATEFRVGPFTFVAGGEDVEGSFGETFRTYFMNRQNIIVNTPREIHTSARMTYSNGIRDGRKLYDSLVN